MSEPREDFWKSPLGRETEFGYLLESALVPHNLNPEIVLNNENSSVLRVLRRELKHAERFLFSVAFVTPRALALLKQELVDFRGTGTIVTSDYLGFNSPGVFKELKALEKVGVSARVHSSKAFHAKGYIFRRPDRSVALFGGLTPDLRSVRYESRPVAPLVGEEDWMDHDHEKTPAHAGTDRPQARYR